MGIKKMIDDLVELAVDFGVELGSGGSSDKLCGKVDGLRNKVVDELTTLRSDLARVTAEGDRLREIVSTCGELLFRLKTKIEINKLDLEDAAGKWQESESEDDPQD